MPGVDVMAFGAHPDDIEIGCGGTLIKLVDAGRSVVMVDMVRGEMGTRGTAETRAAEAETARKIIGAEARENLELEDGFLEVTKEAKARIARVVRRHRPGLILVPYYQGRHPDHFVTSDIVYQGAFLAGLARFDTGQEAFRPPRLLYYGHHEDFQPGLVVDITEQYERKWEAIYAYATQFRPDAGTWEQTRLTAPGFRTRLEHRMGSYGALIGKPFGEGFIQRGHLESENLLDLRFASF